jgi:demethylmenaquinone methyltransferase/2-methoxy-6-polyprenyl-1,4-benzoquinol methylase
MSPNQISIERYRQRAASYDASAEFTMPLRRRTIALLALQPGDVVLDVGAGTGLSFALLLAAVGPQGRVLAFEQSPEMFEQAQARVAREGWQGRVWLQCCAAEAVKLPQPPDAVLFNYVHDISRLAPAVDNVMRQLKPGARVAMAGMKFFPWWTGPLNLLAWLKNRPYNALAADLWSPWDRVEPWCDGFERWSTQWGMGYIARGRLRDPAAQVPARVSPGTSRAPASMAARTTARKEIER